MLDRFQTHGVVDHTFFQLTARPDLRELPRVLLGQSMGGAVSLKVYLKEPNNWDAVMLVAPMCKVSSFLHCIVTNAQQLHYFQIIQEPILNIMVLLVKQWLKFKSHIGIIVIIKDFVRIWMLSDPNQSIGKLNYLLSWEMWYVANSLNIVT